MILKRNIILALLLSLAFIYSFSQDSLTRKKIYLIPGLGSDGRIYSKLHLEKCDTTIIEFVPIFKKETLEHYAKRLSVKIDTTHAFYLIGVSLGGMCAVEMCKYLHPVKTIIISSSMTENEIPFRYKFERVIPLQKIFGGRFYKFMTNLLRPIVEPESKHDKQIFKAMVHDKDPKFMKRSINCIVHWKNKKTPPNVVHIHGTRDHTLPYRRVKDPITVIGGSHMMTLVRAEEISKLINEELNKK